jgi:hypothetical protein
VVGKTSWLGSSTGARVLQPFRFLAVRALWVVGKTSWLEGSMIAGGVRVLGCHHDSGSRCRALGVGGKTSWLEGNDSPSDWMLGVGGKTSWLEGNDSSSDWMLGVPPPFGLERWWVRPVG